MKGKNTETGVESRPVWASLEAFARQGVQRLLQQVPDEEVEAMLGRGRYERRAAVDGTPGYRNGRGKPRRPSLTSGTITVRRLRVRGLGAVRESAPAAVQAAHGGGGIVCAVGAVAGDAVVLAGNGRKSTLAQLTAGAALGCTGGVAVLGAWATGVAVWAAATGAEVAGVSAPAQWVRSSGGARVRH